MKLYKEEYLSLQERKLGVTAYDWKSIEKEAKAVMYNEHNDELNKLPFIPIYKENFRQKAYLDKLIQKDMC